MNRTKAKIRAWTQILHAVSTDKSKFYKFRHMVKFHSRNMLIKPRDIQRKRNQGFHTVCTGNNAFEASSTFTFQLEKKRATGGKGGWPPQQHSTIVSLAWVEGLNLMENARLLFKATKRSSSVCSPSWAAMRRLIDFEQQGDGFHYYWGI